MSLVEVLGPLVDRWLYFTARTRRSALPPTDRANIGSANVTAPGWANLDNSPSAWLARHPRARMMLAALHLLPNGLASGWPPDLILHDVRHSLPWADNALRYAYTSHLLEHLHPDEAERLLKECFRVLRPGGFIRVVVPDLELFARRYVNAASAGTVDELAVESAGHELLEICGVSARSSISARNPHRWMYDRWSLKRLLLDAGFVDVRFHSAGQGELPDLATLDVRGAISLHAEGRRP